MTHPHTPRPDASSPEADRSPRYPLGRRAFLRGATAGAAGAAAFGGVTLATDASPPSASGRRIPFEGPHQAGIITPAQAAAAFVSFRAIAPDRAALCETFRTLTERIRHLTAGGPA